MTYYDIALIIYGFTFGILVTSIFVIVVDIYLKKKYESH